MKINKQVLKKIILINCYHCSKYNINTKRLKISDLDNTFKLIKKLLQQMQKVVSNAITLQIQPQQRVKKYLQKMKNFQKLT